MNYCKCPECGFDFMSKMIPRGTTEDPEYHGLFVVLCRTCLAEFFVPTRSPWGPSRGERLELCTIEDLEWNTTESWREPYPSRSRLIRTGTSTHAADRSLPLGDMADFSQLTCPSCTTHGDLGQMPKPGLCPKCGQAELQWSGVE